jgi:hypothetical protein
LVTSKSVSSSHARIIVDVASAKRSSSARLVDSSLNGTFINDVRVHKSSHALRSGDSIRFGYDVEVYRFFFPQHLPKDLANSNENNDKVYPKQQADPILSNVERSSGAVPIRGPRPIAAATTAAGLATQDSEIAAHRHRRSLSPGGETRDARTRPAAPPFATDIVPDRIPSRQEFSNRQSPTTSSSGARQVVHGHEFDSKGVAEALIADTVEDDNEGSAAARLKRRRQSAGLSNNIPAGISSTRVPTASLGTSSPNRSSSNKQNSRSKSPPIPSEEVLRERKSRRDSDIRTHLSAFPRRSPGEDIPVEVAYPSARQKTIVQDLEPRRIPSHASFQTDIAVPDHHYNDSIQNGMIEENNKQGTRSKYNDESQPMENFSVETFIGHQSSNGQRRIAEQIPLETKQHNTSEETTQQNLERRRQSGQYDQESTNKNGENYSNKGNKDQHPVRNQTSTQSLDHSKHSFSSSSDLDHGLSQQGEIEIKGEFFNSHNVPQSSSSSYPPVEHTDVDNKHPIHTGETNSVSSHPVTQRQRKESVTNVDPIRDDNSQALQTFSERPNTKERLVQEERNDNKHQNDERLNQVQYNRYDQITETDNRPSGQNVRTIQDTHFNENIREREQQIANDYKEQRNSLQGSHRAQQYSKEETYEQKLNEKEYNPRQMPTPSAQPSIGHDFELISQQYQQQHRNSTHVDNVNLNPPAHHNQGRPVDNVQHIHTSNQTRNGMMPPQVLYSESQQRDMPTRSSSNEQRLFPPPPRDERSDFPQQRRSYVDTLGGVILDDSLDMRPNVSYRVGIEPDPRTRMESIQRFSNDHPDLNDSQPVASDWRQLALETSSVLRNSDNESRSSQSRVAGAEGDNRKDLYIRQEPTSTIQSSTTDQVLTYKAQHVDSNAHFQQRMNHESSPIYPTTVFPTSSSSSPSSSAPFNVPDRHVPQDPPLRQLVAPSVGTSSDIHRATNLPISSTLHHPVQSIRNEQQIEYASQKLQTAQDAPPGSVAFTTLPHGYSKEMSGEIININIPQPVMQHDASSLPRNATTEPLVLAPGGIAWVVPQTLSVSSTTIPNSATVPAPAPSPAFIYSEAVSGLMNVPLADPSSAPQPVRLNTALSPSHQRALSLLEDVKSEPLSPLLARQKKLSASGKPMGSAIENLSASLSFSRSLPTSPLAPVGASNTRSNNLLNQSALSPLHSIDPLYAEERSRMREEVTALRSVARELRSMVEAQYISKGSNSLFSSGSHEKGQEILKKRPASLTSLLANKDASGSVLLRRGFLLALSNLSSILRQATLRSAFATWHNASTLITKEREVMRSQHFEQFRAEFQGQLDQQVTENDREKQTLLMQLEIERLKLLQSSNNAPFVLPESTGTEFVPVFDSSINASLPVEDGAVPNRCRQSNSTTNKEMFKSNTTCLGGSKC